MVFTLPCAAASLGRTTVEPIVFRPRDAAVALMAGFAAMVRGERENPYTYDYELTLFRTLLACCGVDNTAKGEQK